MRRNESSHSWSFAAQCEVERIQVDWAVEIQLGSGEGRYILRIESPFVMNDGTNERLVVPEIPATAGGVLAALRQRVVRLEAFDDGHMELELSESSISVAAAEDFEPWGITGPGGLRVVSLPGGELAVWLSTEDPP